MANLVNKQILSHVPVFHFSLSTHEYIHQYRFHTYFVPSQFKALGIQCWNMSQPQATWSFLANGGGV